MLKINNFNDIRTISDLRVARHVEALYRANVNAVCNYDPGMHGYVILADASVEDFLATRIYEIVYKESAVYLMYVVTSNSSCDTYVIPRNIKWSDKFFKFLEGAANECNSSNK